MSLLNIEGYNNLKKDPASGGVVNVDSKSYENYMMNKSIAKRNIQQQKSTHDSVTKMQDEINTIKNDLSDIRTLLMKLLQKGN